MDRRKAMVRDAYDAVADAWGRARRAVSSDAREREWMGRFLAALPNAARVLDLGCGSGAPILAELVERGYHVTGVDFSREQIMRARAQCPSANVLQGDLAEIEFAPASFDGVIAYDSIWHVPRAEHARIFERISSWLTTRGSALVTLAAAENADGDGLFTELMGASVFYDAFPKAVSLQMLATAGLRPVAHDLRPIDSSQPETGHLITLVRK